MKSKKRLILLLALICIAVASLCAGCSVGPQSFEEFIDQNALVSSVTYYSNGGSFSSDRSVITLYYKQGAPVINVDTEGNSGVEFKRSGYIFSGWYYVQLDEEGKPCFEEGSTVNVLIDESKPANLADLKAVENEHLYVGAKWTIDVRIQLVLASESPVTLADETTVVQKGETVGYVSFGNSSSITLYDNIAPVTSDSTFLAFYADAEMTTPLTSAVAKPTDGQDVKVYIEYLKGKWTLVKTASNVASMFAGTAGSSNNYYILNDIDCAGTSVNMSGNNFACTIEGNGYTISNLTFSATGIRSGLNSMLGNLTSTAKISNLTLKDIEVSFRLHTVGTPSLYLLFQGMQDGATFENFNIDGIEETIRYTHVEGSCFVNNIQLMNGVYDTANWIYGGYEKDSDFVNAGINITGASLTINNEKIVNQEVSNE